MFEDILIQKYYHEFLNSTATSKYGLHTLVLSHALEEVL